MNPTPPGGHLRKQDQVFVDSSVAPTISPAPAGNVVVPAGWVRQVGSNGEADNLLLLNGVYVPNPTQFVVPYFSGGWPPDPLTGTPGHTQQNPR